MQVRIKRYEFFGVVLLLLSSVWQFFIAGPMAALAADSDAYYLEDKIDKIWMLLADDYTHTYEDRAGFMSFADVKSFQDAWEFTGDEKNERIERQAKVVSIISASVAILGSLLVIFAKYLEWDSASKAAS